MRTVGAAVLATCCALILALLGWGELEHWRASRRGLGRFSGESGGRTAVIVLGARNVEERANAVNQWRVRAGLRSLAQEPVGSYLVMCGGPTSGGRSEAEVMAEYARESCGYQGPLVLEAESRTTRENIENAIPLVESAARIKIVSEPHHAEQARRYLRLRRPDLAHRLVRAANYRFGESILRKPLLAVRGRRRLRRAVRRDGPLPTPRPPEAR